MANLLKLNLGYDSCWSSLVLQPLGIEVTGEDAYDDGEQVTSSVIFQEDEVL